MADMEALRQLRRVVEAAPEHLLHMRSVAEEASCGTARCAMGWAMVDPWFLARGAADVMSMRWLCQLIRFQDLLGLSHDDTARLFAHGIDGRTSEHAISKAAVLWNIDELLAGRPARVYRVLVIGDEASCIGPIDEYEDLDHDQVVPLD